MARPNATTPAEAPAEAPAEVTAPPVDDSFVGQAITRANKLLAAKAAILKDLGEVRMILNMANGQGLTTPEQKAWIEDKLPKRTRKSGAAAETDDEQ